MVTVMSDGERRSRAWVLGSSLLLVASSGCQEQPLHQNAAPGREVTRAYNAALVASTTRNAAPAEVSTAPDVIFTLQDGFQLSLASLRGKFVTVFFCASAHSAACIGEAQALRAHWRELHEERLVAVVGVTRETPAEQRAFLKDQALPLDLASDPDGQLAQSFGLPPSGDYGFRAVLIGRDGRIRRSWLTPNPESQTRELLALASELPSQ